MPTVSRIAVLMSLMAVGLAAGCGDRLKVELRVHVPFSLPAHRAIPLIEDHLDPDLLEALGGTLPERWPDDAPPVRVHATFESAVDVARDDLAPLEHELERARAGERELRARQVRFVLDPRNMNVPLEDLALFVEDPLDPEATRRMVGHVADLDAGEGVLVFAPGGRLALADAFLEEDLRLSFEATVRFDSAADPTRPSGSGRIDLTLVLDAIR